MPPAASPLPYTDTKPHGHADFYFAVNATFRFILARFGYEKLKRYWTDIGSGYYKPVSDNWKLGGLAAVAEYWRAFFVPEPGAEVEIMQADDAVTVEVRTCPLIKHLRDHGREIVPCLCQHCYYVNDAIAGPAGMTVRVKGGNGCCTQRFVLSSRDEPPQQPGEIKEATA
ncbi:MAG: L-2-amino-thiazoline-4-carboxylic acid hydrolase [Verrucomicrobiaceae bacterium]|nr:L-2-amino-thiazoline-4-carboxylic acid hydrolase [Verrucomicrobiaceae bacterium]